MQERGKCGVKCGAGDDPEGNEKEAEIRDQHRVYSV